MMTETLPPFPKTQKYVCGEELKRQREKDQELATIARAMKAKGMNFWQIFEATGLQPEIIQSL